MLTVVIQAGGLSKRMGHDKGLLPFLGQPLVKRLIDRLSPLADELLVVSNNPAGYAFLGLPIFADVYPGRGALGGLYTALKSASQPLVAVVACDMPFASPELLSYQCDLLGESSPAQLDAAIPRTEQGTEPFHSVYRRETCLPLAEAAIRADLWRVDSWFGKAHIRYVEPGEAARFDPYGRAFMNVNTPEDLETAEKIAKES